MKAGPAPAGDPHPSNAPEQSIHLRADPGANVPPSNTTIADTNSTGGSATEGGGRWAAAVLLLTHIIEVAAMLTVILARVIPALEETHSTEDNGNSIWNQPILCLQISLTTAPLALITAVSLVWAVRAQDFSGRTTARMLCWLLHILQASIVWRFLKVHLAFDSSDVAELGTLRFVQIHVHTLPFLVMHMAIILGDAATPDVILVLAATVLVVSAVVAIVVSTTASHSSRPSSLTPPTITQVAHNPIHGRQQGPEHTSNHDYAARVVVAVTTACVIWSRAVAVAALFCLTLTWTSVLIALHWIAALIWLSLQDELEPNTLGPLRRLLRRVFLAYLLLWDWHVFRDDASAMTVCARPRLPAAYYSITAIQNVAVTATWYTASKVALPVVRTAILSSVLAAQAVALLLLALSYLYCSSLLPSWPRNKACALARTASLVTPSAKSANPTAPVENHDQDSSSYVDFKDAEDGVVPDLGKDKKDLEDSKDAVVTPLKNLPPMAHSTPRSPLPLAPRLMAAHLPPAMFSFSHDILPPRLTKSERSSTDNGSFNSRNTNTLPTQLPPEYDLLQRAHGSFSDSFSSLSCGTISRATANVRALAIHDPQSQRTPTPIRKPSYASHSSCRNGYCHCKLFDGIEGPCDVEEEDEEEEKDTDSQKANSENGCSDRIKNGFVVKCNNMSSKPGTSKSKGVLSSSENEQAICDSAPRVDVVRGIQRFRVVCAACLHAHDPLLTRCHAHTPVTETHLSSRCLTTPLMRCHTGATLSQSCSGLGGGSSTDYPSDTEVTATADTLSSASADSHSTYTTWPVGRGPGMARLLQLHPGSHDYVTAWLRHQQARGPRAPPPPPPQVPSESLNLTIPEGHVRRQRRPRRHLPRPLRHKDPPPPHLLQDLETVCAAHPFGYYRYICSDIKFIEYITIISSCECRCNGSVQYVCYSTVSGRGRVGTSVVPLLSGAWEAQEVALCIETYT
ncbi:hypothetical protein SK128_019846 [Halocaridina rubra]|uniref:XK-related protein n=1 Tax=Halocaridina rubra TaxID=373956 RepID=A0AAN8X219_HALRR